MKAGTLTRKAAPLACPAWCVRDITDPDDDSVIHEGAVQEIVLAGGASLVPGTLTMRLDRYDASDGIGEVAVSIDLTQPGIDMNAVELRHLAAVALHLADQLEVTR